MDKALDGVAERDTDLAEALGRHGRVGVGAGVVSRAEAMRAQVLLSVVEPDGSEGAGASFRADAEYFYPASAIKALVAVAALRRLGALRRGGAAVSLDSPLRFQPLGPGDPGAAEDGVEGLAGVGAAPGTRLTLRRLLRRALVVSDNAAANRLYDFAGRARVAETASALGLRSAAVWHRLSDPRGLTDHAPTPAVRVGTGRGALTIAAEDGRSGPAWEEAGGPGVLIGRGFQRADGVVQPGPVPFARRNRCSLADLHRLVRLIAGMERADAWRTATGLTDADRVLLRAMMAEVADERGWPGVARPPEGLDNAMKPLLPGLRRVLGERLERGSVTYVNKVGQAYGFTVENAAVRDEVSGRSVAISAVLMTNANGILNDDRYEYGVAAAWMETLGRVVGERLLTAGPVGP